MKWGVLTSYRTGTWTRKGAENGYLDDFITKDPKSGRKMIWKSIGDADRFVLLFGYICEMLRDG